MVIIFLSLLLLSLISYILSNTQTILFVKGV